MVPPNAPLNTMLNEAQAVQFVGASRTCCLHDKKGFQQYSVHYTKCTWPGPLTTCGLGNVDCKHLPWEAQCRDATIRTSAL